ncbi:TolB-like translocation protein [Qiania dongpingensis]|uniref:DUF5050 domain-containing protein n=1 Tax=Qiania dongpingensis TaxID=2763669 RepID=A0A7G9G748_9FIRM|nr:hypothetical protein [Qiania dongpingensis]QNM06630.1 hypothetical protein H9Q78_05825 [Qiania dongpingensis]
MKMFRIFLFFSASVLILAGCGKKKKTDNAEESVWRMNSCFTKTGILYKKSDINGKIKYYDYETKEYLTLCAKANCRHDSSECMAVYLYQNIDFMGKLGDKWYYHVMKTDEDEGAFYSCDLDGGNEKKIGSFSHGNGYAIGTVNLFYGDVCVLETEDDHFDDATGEWTGTASGIYRYHFDTGEAEVLCEEKEYMRPAYSVFGKYKNKLIYTEWDGEKNLLRQMDLDTREITSPLGNVNIVTGSVQGDTLLCSAMEDEKYELVIADLETGDQENIWTKGIASDFFWDEELKLFMIYGEESVVTEDGYTRQIFELYQYMEDGTCRLMRTGDTAKCFIPYVRVEDQLIGRDSKKGELARIKAEDFIQGSGNWEILNE